MTNDRLRKLFGDDPELIKRFVAHILREIPLQLDVLVCAARDGDTETLRNTAHALKSQLAYFDEETLGSIAASLEFWTLPPSVDEERMLRQFLADTEHWLRRLHLEWPEIP